MGQKVNPIGMRLGIIKTWNSRWFASKDYAKYVFEDHQLRKFLKKQLYHAGISRIDIERSSNRIKLRIFAARPGIIIGKKGSEIEALKKTLEKMVTHEVLVDIQEVRKPEIDAQLVAENVANQLIRRIAFRRAMKRSVSSSMRFGAQGIKIICSGRLGGACPGSNGVCPALRKNLKPEKAFFTISPNLEPPYCVLPDDPCKIPIIFLEGSLN